MIDVSIVIVNYNSGEWLERAIRAVMDTTSGLACEVIVSDNGSQDDSDSQAEKIFGSKIRLLRLGANKGFAAANNAALPYCHGRNILFLNPDTEVQSEAIRRMSTYLDEHDRVGACGGNLFLPDGKAAFSYWMTLPGVRFEWNRLFSDLFLRLRYKGSQEHNYTGKVLNVAHSIGADLMVKKAVLDEVGGMDEAFFLFYEETELCYRIHRAGYTIVNIPDARITHAEGQTIDALGRRLPYMMKSRKLYMDKCLTSFSHIVADGILWLSSSVRVAWFTLRGNAEKKQYWYYIKEHIRS